MSTDKKTVWDGLEPVIDWIEEFPVYWRHANRVTRGQRNVERITKSRYAPEGKRRTTKAKQRKAG